MSAGAVGTRRTFPCSGCSCAGVDGIGPFFRHPLLFRPGLLHCHLSPTIKYSSSVLVSAADFMSVVDVWVIVNGLAKLSGKHGRGVMDTVALRGQMWDGSMKA